MLDFTPFEDSAGEPVKSNQILFPAEASYFFTQVPAEPDTEVG